MFRIMLAIVIGIVSLSAVSSVPTAKSNVDVAIWAAEHLGEQANGLPKTVHIEPNDETCYAPEALSQARNAAIDHAESVSGTVIDRELLLSYLETVEPLA